jgi:hypothetical protein
MAERIAEMVRERVGDVIRQQVQEAMRGFGMGAQGGQMGMGQVGFGMPRPFTNRQ